MTTYLFGDEPPSPGFPTLPRRMVEAAALEFGAAKPEIPTPFERVMGVVSDWLTRIPATPTPAPDDEVFAGLMDPELQLKAALDAYREAKETTEAGWRPFTHEGHRQALKAALAAALSLHHQKVLSEVIAGIPREVVEDSTSQPGRELDRLVDVAIDLMGLMVMAPRLADRRSLLRQAAQDLTPHQRQALHASAVGLIALMAALDRGEYPDTFPFA